MKRFTTLLLMITSLLLLPACGGGSLSPESSSSWKNATGSISTGLGITTSIRSSASASADKNGTAQVDSVIAALTFDNDGKITECIIDSTQTMVDFDDSGKITGDFKAEIQTKAEKGDNYGMKKASSIGKEWHQQADAFSAWTIGKTIDEVKGLKTKKVDDSTVPDDAELTSSVTINVGEFMTAVEKSAANAENVSFNGSYKSGLGIVSKSSNSKNAAVNADGYAQIDTTLAAVTLDNNGVIIACSIESALTRVEFNSEGKLTSDINAEILSKTELGDDYGMKKVSAIEKEWYEQAAAFADWTIGKTIDEVKNLKTKKIDDSHPAVPDDPELVTSVSITVGDYMKAIEKAVANAK